MIRVLDSFVSDKIAAGEVIERPVSIVKELVENSIDAGANSIIVEIRNGGKTYIRVTDNGLGISKDEISIAFLRHATSKIESLQDLDNLDSLGFRGEALASIAAVSRLTIVTRTNQETSGTKLIMHGGREISKDTVGANIGTTIVVEDVFYNIPARRKFMGSDAREAAVIIELIEHYAICYDNIRFMIINNGATVFTTDGDGDKLNAIRSALPQKEYQNLIPVSSSLLNGYISDPGTTKSNKRGQLLFVNGRLVSSTVIERGIEKGYGDRVFSGYPIAILFINVDPSSIDVNIHPGKKEINFLNKDIVINEIANAIKSVMNTEDSVPCSNVIKEESPYLQDSMLFFNNENSESKESDSSSIKITDYLKNIDRNIEQPRKFLNETDSLFRYNSPLNDKEEETSRSIDRSIMKSYEAPRPFEFADLQFKGYIFNAYIIMQSENNIYLLDQHAAHERIFYEKLSENFRSMKQSAQPILTPFIINVSVDIYSTERNWMQSLKTMGYDIDDFGPETFIIKGIPQYMNMSEAENFARTFIENSIDFEDNRIVIDKLIMKSCKSAVKANEALSKLEIDDLIRELSQCKNPFSCPHGRPTFIKVTKYEIERSFRRK